MKPYKKIVLKNGLRIILAPRKESPTATAMVLVEAGSKYEDKKINGISHFLEHLCFKGTKKRPTSFDITSELESLGSAHNAFTSHEMTGYHSKVASDKIYQALDIIADLYVNPVIKEEEMEKEKGVIIEEINMYEDLPQRKAANVFMEVVYGDQPAGRPVSGLKEVIRSLSRSDILKYRSSHYVAEATVVVVAGGFNEKKILSQIKTLFKDIPTTKNFSKEKVDDSQGKPNFRLVYKNTDQSHLVVGFRAFDMYDKRRATLSVLSDIVGGGMSSRLFQKIRDVMGAAYYIHTGSDLLTDHGYWAVVAGADNKRAFEVLEAIMQEFRKVAIAPVTEKELDRSKKHLTGQILMGLETSEDLATFYGEQEVFKEKIKKPEDLIKEIKAVTAKDILAVAKDMIRNEKLNLAMIGPFKEMPKDFIFKI